MLSDNSEVIQLESNTSLSATNLFSLTRVNLEKALEQNFALSKFRAQQIFEWVYRRGVYDFAQMSNLNKQLRHALAQAFSFKFLNYTERMLSNDGTRKYLFKLKDGEVIEAVMIKQPKRMTLCVSSQVGCGMGCKFCRTATMGFRRNLGIDEIVGQVIAVLEDAKDFGDSFNNIVFMGMGEPLHNYDNVVAAIQILIDRFGLNIAPRKITVSSVGLLPAISKFILTGPNVSFALSLNATNDKVRTQLMPINKAFPIKKLLAGIRELPFNKRRKLTVEYVMLKDINDSDLDLRELPRLLHGIRAKLNLIPYNENAGLGFKQPDRERIHYWQKTLNSRGIETTVRWSKGADIQAACGQLAAINAPINTSGLLQVT